MSFSMSVVVILDALRSGNLAELVRKVNEVTIARGIGIAETWREVSRCLAPRPALEAQYREWAGADSTLAWDNIPAAIPCEPQPAVPVAYFFGGEPAPSPDPFADVRFAPNPRCACGHYLPCGCEQHGRAGCVRQRLQS